MFTSYLTAFLAHRLGAGARPWLKRQSLGWHEFIMATATTADFALYVCINGMYIYVAATLGVCLAESPFVFVHHFAVCQ